MLWAPIHIQAELVSTPIASFGGPPSATCAADAIARVSFKPQDEILVGQRFRFTWPCGPANWFIYGRPGKIPPTSPDTVVGDLKRGDKVELIFNAHPPYSTGWYGKQTISAFSNAPILDPKNWPSWYDKSFIPPDLLHPPKPAFEPLPPKPAFPTRDVTVTFVVSSHPGEVFTAAYSVAARRIFVAAPAHAAKDTPDLVQDIDVSLKISIWNGRKAYAIQMDPDADLYSNFFLRAAVGSETIAGFHCDDYDIQPNRWSAEPVAPSRVCLTGDGIHMKKITAGVTTTVTSVKYGPVDPDASVIRYGYSRVPAADDTPGKPAIPPIWLD